MLNDGFVKRGDVVFDVPVRLAAPMTMHFPENADDLTMLGKTEVVPVEMLINHLVIEEFVRYDEQAERDGFLIPVDREYRATGEILSIIGSVTRGPDKAQPGH